MASTAASSTHQSLADYIKGVHAHLRQRVREGVDVDQVWNEHITAEHEMRQRYASTMRQLATSHWENSEKDSESERDNRIEWIHQNVIAYFFGSNGGESRDASQRIDVDQSGLFNAVCKDVRRRMFESDLLAKDPNTGRPLLTEAEATAVATKAQQRWHQCIFDLKMDFENLDIPKDFALALIDVGSCYDPFARFDIFSTLAVDISPSTDSVVEMDFVSVPVSAACVSEGSPRRLKLHMHDAVKKELVADSFHVVVFSLLLEYFPSTRHRWICCMKASRILRMDGILVIVTPDSSHVNKRAAQMKSWREALETHLGFKRWKYEKLTHLHCMIYRKVKQIRGSASEEDFVPYHSLLYIPQDHNDSKTTPVCIETS